MTPGSAASPRTLVELLRVRAEREPGRTAFTFYDESHAVVSFSDLDRDARAAAALIQQHAAPGDRALLLYPPGREYVVGFLGCLYAGVIAVPAYPPDPMRLGRTLPRLSALVADCGARLALTASSIVDLIQPVVSEVPSLRALQWLSTSEAKDTEAWRPATVRGEDVAFLQYTSGSTGTPKGVMLTHRNLLHNLGLIAEGFAATQPAVGVIWLPPYHDMGLIGGILQPIYGGIPTSLMSPLTFLQHPAGWLEEISRLKGQGNVVSGGPNFAFDLAVRKTTAAQRAALDLSHWEVAFCGAEPIRAETLRRFAAAFAVSGFREEAFLPCYGLAEGTLIVTGGPRRAKPIVQGFTPESVGAGAPEPGGPLELVGSGRIIGDQQLEIVDPVTHQRALPGRVGEIWISGASVAEGYWQKPEETHRALEAELHGVTQRTFLRTGDLGFLRDGELFVTGRQKDLIIVRGQNLYPQDIELSAERAHPGLRPGCTAAFSVEADGEEQVVVVLEAQRGLDEEAQTAAIAAVRAAVSDQHAVHLHQVVLIPPGALPKTSSGKVQRSACRAALLDGSLEVWVRSGGEATSVNPAALPPPAADADAATLSRYVQSVAQALLGRAVSPQTPLAEAGLDSLRAMELAARLSSELGVEYGIGALLRARSLDEVVEGLRRAPKPVQPDAGSRSDLCTDGQRALWFLDRRSPDDAAYNVARALRLHGAIDLAALEEAFRALSLRHETLRAHFVTAQGALRYRVSEHPWQLDRVDAAAWTEAGLLARLDAEASRPFPSEGAPLVRAQLYAGCGDPVLLLVLHHAITDFWSLAVMAREFAALYEAARSGVSVPLPPLVSSMGALAEQEQKRLASADGEALRSWWRGTLSGAEASLTLPRAGRARGSGRGAAVPFQLSEQHTRALLSLAAQERTTPFVVLLAGWFAFLHRWTGQERITVGAPAAGRDRAETHGVLGYLVNPVALSVQIDPIQDLRALIGRVREQVVGALEHAALPIARVAEAVSAGQGGLYQTLFAFQRPPAGAEALTPLALELPAAPVELGSLRLSALPLPSRAAPVELALVAGEHANGISGWFEYQSGRFTPELAERLRDGWTALIEALLSAPETPVSHHQTLSDAERARVLSFGRGPQVARPFAPLPQRIPWRSGRAALVRGLESVTYAQLRLRVDAMRAGLYAAGVRKGAPVAVAVDRTLEGVVALLALLELGAVYVPLELRHPDERLAFMVGDVGARWILAHRGDRERVSRWGAQVIDLDEPGTGAPAPVAEVAPGDPAYVIYTSGSTGQPKGVEVPHRGLANLAGAQIEGFGITPESRVLQFASCGFDAAISEIAMALGAGAALHLMHGEGRHPALELPRLLRAERITTVTLPPSVLAVLDPAGLSDLKTIISAGEPCSAALVARWAPGRTFINAYGPTEVSVCASFGRCAPGDGTPGIGRPLQNLQLYVVDRAGNLVPPGVPGELWVGGVGVANGYVRRPELTAQRFTVDPFSAEAGRVYRTGDRVRWSEDGALEFLGRMDDQVKVRGHRIELGEVEAALRRLLPVRDAAASVHTAPSGEQVLCAYLVGGEALPADRALRERLRADLPDALVPSTFVAVTGLPLTPNGKVDRRALPPPAFQATETASAPPQTPLEQTVATAWARALGRPAIGVHDHFFDELGGSSITVMQAAANLKEALQQEVPLTHFFEHPTVHAFAQKLSAAPAAVPDDARSRADARREALNRRLRKP